MNSVRVGQSWATTLYKTKPGFPAFQYFSRILLEFVYEIVEIARSKPVDPLHPLHVREENPGWKFRNPCLHHLVPGDELENHPKWGKF